LEFVATRGNKKRNSQERKHKRNVALLPPG